MIGHWCGRLSAIPTALVDLSLLRRRRHAQGVTTRLALMPPPPFDDLHSVHRHTRGPAREQPVELTHDELQRTRVLDDIVDYER